MNGALASIGKNYTSLIKTTKKQLLHHARFLEQEGKQKKRRKQIAA